MFSTPTVLKRPTYTRARTDQSRHIWLLFRACHTREILKPDICNGQVARVLIAQRFIALPIALRQLNRPVDIVDIHGVVSDVLNIARTAATLEVS